MLSCNHRLIGGRIHHVSLRMIKALSIFVTFVLVTLLWVIFRADDLGMVGRVFKAMFTVHSGISQPYTWTFFAIVVVGVATYAAYIRSAENRVPGFYPVLELSRFWKIVLFFVFSGLTIIMGYLEIRLLFMGGF